MEVVLGTHTDMYFSTSKKHRLHSPLEKSLIERIMQYYKDRTECFEDDYYILAPAKRRKRIVIKDICIQLDKVIHLLV
jgi:hypothetical protein